MPASKAQQKAVHKYTKENYDRFLVTMKPKGRLETVKAHAAARGESANGFIGRAIQETMERDAGGPQEGTEPGAVFFYPQKPSKPHRRPQKPQEMACRSLLHAPYWKQWSGKRRPVSDRH